MTAAEKSAILCVRNIVFLMNQQGYSAARIHKELERDCNPAYQLYLKNNNNKG